MQRCDFAIQPYKVATDAMQRRLEDGAKENVGRKEGAGTAFCVRAKAASLPTALGLLVYLRARPCAIKPSPCMVTKLRARSFQIFRLGPLESTSVAD